MKHLYSLLCEKVIKDAESFSVSFINLFEKLTVNLEQKDNETSPIVFIPYKHELVICWQIQDSSIDKREIELEVHVLDPSNNSIGTMPITFEASAQGKTLRVNIRLDGIPVSTSGDYLMKVVQKEGQDNTVLSEIPFEIEIHRKVTA